MNSLDGILSALWYWAEGGGQELEQGTLEEVPAEVMVRGMVAQPRAVEEEVAGRERTGDLFWS